ncbi:hypothetical protein Taro_047508 [Colocasia esculenta]|uniref:Uncharacterized protein n=1 Tax=Colocasia esculenta TaxID=4460 RepID=A0A843WT44_COLES|nr:hypothetical protein [Colocasia esculenta]
MSWPYDTPQQQLRMQAFATTSSLSSYGEYLSTANMSLSTDADSCEVLGSGKGTVPLLDNSATPAGRSTLGPGHDLANPASATPSFSGRPRVRRWHAHLPCNMSPNMATSSLLQAPRSCCPRARYVLLHTGDEVTCRRRSRHAQATKNSTTGALGQKGKKGEQRKKK